LRWCGSVRGTAPTRNVEWFRFLQYETHNLQNGLLSSFQRPIPSRIPRVTGFFLSGLDEFAEGVCL
jgi:hypothetical protein